MLLSRTHLVGCDSSFNKFVCFNEHIDGVIVLMIVLNIVVYKLRQLCDSKYGGKDKTLVLSSAKTCRRFSLTEIERATHNFADEFVIGQGGSGKVYKGIIDNGSTIVAIKRLSSLSKEGSTEFWKEIEMVSQFKHCHLLDLIGYCDESRVMILVYEYMPKGTLADHLHRTGRKGNNSPLSWVQRLRICIGAARGLDYLHTGTSTRQRVIHRDVKSTNILLDETFEAKISDFGLFKIGPANQASSSISTNVKGTFGYIDPEYFLTRTVTRKSDVYAFGVVLLEAVCGRRAVDLSVDDDQRGLVGWVKICIKEGRVHQILDYSLNMQIVPNSLIAFLKIADQCLHSQPKCRPTMAEIVAMLEFALTLQENEDSSEVEEAVTSYQYSALLSTSEDVMYSGCYPMSFARKIRQLLAAPSRMIPVQNRVNNRVRLDNMGIVQVAKGRIVTTNIKMFTSRELRYATRNFSSNMQLSEGWYGSIFIAWVNEKTFAPSRAGRGMGLIIKRFNSREGHKEVQKEVDHYGTFRHPNVVKLLGFCLEDQEFILVYEYMQKGNLERYIYKEYAEPLPWVVWLKILIVAARFLAFLHTAENQTIYNHFNPYNILLDGDFNAKIVGCGVARFASADEGDTFLTSQQVLDTTRSYLSPEYVEAGCLSVKNDVFSFGVLLLEILTGMRVSDFDGSHKKQNLVKWMRPLLTDERMVKRIMYPKLPDHDKFLEGKILSDIPKLVLECLDRNPEKRPSMMEVLEMLEEISEFSI